MHRFKRKAFLIREFWRGGRVVDCGGLENRCTERYPGFESLSLRRKQLNNGCFFIGKYLSKYTRRGARVVEEARLESVYTPKGYPGFESPSLRNKHWKSMAYKVNTRFYTQECKVGCFYIHLRNHVLVVIIICA